MYQIPNRRIRRTRAAAVAIVITEITLGARVHLPSRYMVSSL